MRKRPLPTVFRKHRVRHFYRILRHVLSQYVTFAGESTRENRVTMEELYQDFPGCICVFVKFITLTQFIVVVHSTCDGVKKFYRQATFNYSVVDFNAVQDQVAVDVTLAIKRLYVRSWFPQTTLWTNGNTEVDFKHVQDVLRNTLTMRKPISLKLAPFDEDGNGASFHIANWRHDLEFTARAPVVEEPEEEPVDPIFEVHDPMYLRSVLESIVRGRCTTPATTSTP